MPATFEQVKDATEAAGTELYQRLGPDLLHTYEGREQLKAALIRVVEELGWEYQAFVDILLAR